MLAHLGYNPSNLNVPLCWPLPPLIRALFEDCAGEPPERPAEDDEPPICLNLDNELNVELLAAVSLEERDNDQPVS